MQGERTFGAPWATSLRLMTGFSVLLLVALALFGMFFGPRANVVWVLGMIVMPLSILTLSVFFLIRGYVLTEDTLYVLRLGWRSSVDLSGLHSVEADSQAMSKSFRTFGNGGMFCFAGLFTNKKLGAFRAFGTDPTRSVVLRFDNRVVVITPDHPEEFVATIRETRET